MGHGIESACRMRWKYMREIKHVWELMECLRNCSDKTVRQRSVMLPWLFNIFMNKCIRNAYNEF